jgi:NADH-quinone oxidoreductase subunit G
MWQVLAELSSLLEDETGIDSAEEALAAVAAEVPFYAGITPEEIGGAGVRWQERAAAASFPRASSGRASVSGFLELGGEREAQGLRLGTYRDLWAAEVTERSPALRFLTPQQSLELSPADAQRLGLASADEVDVRSNGATVRARVSVRERVKPEAGFLIEGLGDGARELRGRRVQVAKAAEAE